MASVLVSLARGDIRGALGPPVGGPGVSVTIVGAAESLHWEPLRVSIVMISVN